MTQTWPPLPLLHQEGNDTEIVEQPANLNTIPTRYVQFSKDFMSNATAANKPFFVRGYGGAGCRSLFAEGAHDA